MLSTDQDQTEKSFFRRLITVMMNAHPLHIMLLHQRRWMCSTENSLLLILHDLSSDEMEGLQSHAISDVQILDTQLFFLEVLSAHSHN